jgi:hypothetical protein
MSRFNQIKHPKDNPKLEACLECQSMSREPEREHEREQNLPFV